MSLPTPFTQLSIHLSIFSSPFPTPTVLCIIHALGVTSSVNIPTKQHTHTHKHCQFCLSLPLLHTLTISHTNYSHPIQSAVHFVDLSVTCPPPLCRDLQHFDRRQAGTGTYKNTYIKLIQQHSSWFDPSEVASRQGIIPSTVLFGRKMGDGVNYGYYCRSCF